MNAKEILVALERFLRPQTFPLTVKFLKSGTEAAPHTKFPKKHLGIQIMPCQGLTMARRYGWSIGMTVEDLKCGTGIIVLGFVEAPPGYYEGKFDLTPSTQGAEVRSVRLEAMDRLPLNQGGCAVVSPLFRNDFEPDLYLVYGTPAQILRLVQASLFSKGGYLHFKSAGGASCAETFAAPMVHDQCTLILIGNGERIFAHAEDHELCFAIPRSKIADTLEGLQATHDGGQRYPIPFNVRFEPDLPERYMKLTKTIKGE